MAQKEQPGAEMRELAKRLAAAEASLARIGQERDLLKFLLDKLPDNIYVKDSQGRYILDNLTHRKFLGQSDEKNVIGKTVYDFFPAEMAESYHADDQKIISSGKPLINREEPIVGVSGAGKWVSTSKIPEFDDKGSVARLICVSRDITDRKLYQDALQKAKEELEARVEQRTADLKAANERLHAQMAQLAEKARLDGEVNAAQSIQRRLIPSFKPQIPRVNIKGAYYPAYEVGGDYLDYFQNEEGNWVIVIADVCGKGIPAALLMTMLRSMVRAEGRHETSARNLLCSVNSSMAVNIDHRSFITALCLVINRDGTAMSYARAGHPPLLKLGVNGGQPQIIPVNGIALGFSSSSAAFRNETQEATIRLDENDRFLMYTDGLLDAEAPDRSCYGQSRLNAFLAELPPLDAETLVTRIMEDVRQFAGGVPYRDDLTVCALQVFGTAPKPSGS